MTRIPIGITSGGTTIAIETSARKVADFERLFAHHSERDKFDALMALRYLALSELRKNPDDKDWLNAINLTHFYVETSLDDRVAIAWSERLGLTSAFAARDYGKSLVHRHFRHL